MRIVSLLPASTEIVWALGRGPDLVGRSHECDHPPPVRDLPTCTEPKFDADGTSYQVDERVRGLLQEGLSVYRVDAERLRALEPDVLLTQDQCEVCAADLDEVLDAARRFLDGDPVVHSAAPASLDEVWESMRGIATVVDAEEDGERVVKGLQQRMRGVAAAVPPGPAPGVLLVEWIAPLMSAGNWMPTLVEMAGGRPLLAEAGQHSPWLEWERVAEADPEVIVVAPCGFGMDRSRSELPVLTERSEWKELRAVREGRVYLADGHHFFNRPGPRLVDSLEILAEILHPDIFENHHRGSGWMPVEAG